MPIALTAIALLLVVSGTLLAVATPFGPRPADMLFWQDGEAPEPDASRVDANIEFPEPLSGLPGTPGQLAVDPSNGDLWFLTSGSSGRTNDLYRYSTSDGTLEKTVLPRSVGGLFSPIAVDSRGHVISAQGGIVLDINPAGGYRDIQLPVPPANFVKDLGSASTYIIDMVLSGDDKAYLTRMSTAAITEVDLRTGSVSEIPIPSSMGQIYFIELAGDRLWMTPGTHTPVTDSRTAVLHLATGVTELISIKSYALVGDGEGRVYVSSPADEGIVAADALDGAIEAGPWQLDESSDWLNWVPGEPDGSGWVPVILAADNARGRVWMAGAGRLASLDPAAGTTENYRLPSWAAAETQLIHVPGGCEYNNDLCPPPRGAFTQIGDIAVAPSGDVFFSDASKRRIGIVHPR